jgi:hypothetical protein
MLTRRTGISVAVLCLIPLLAGCGNGSPLAVVTMTPGAVVVATKNSPISNLPEPHYTDDIPMPVPTYQRLPSGIITPPISPEPTRPLLWGLNFTNLQMLSPSEGWATANGVMVHYTNQRWTKAPYIGLLPNPQDSTGPELAGLAMVSANEGWAVGRDTNSMSAGQSAFLAHFKDDKWSQISLSPTVYNLEAISMPSQNDGWIVGGVFEGGVHFCTLLHYSGGQWTKVDCPAESPLHGIHMLSASEGWAVGEAGTTMHYHNGSWNLVTGYCAGELGDPCHDPNSGPTQGILNSVYMVSPNEAWAVGAEYTSNSTRGMILHFIDGQWEKVDSPADVPLKSVYMVSSDEGWAVGGTDQAPQGDNAIILHYSGGRWVRVDSQVSTALNSVYMISSGEGWAVGSSGIILHYQDGKWSQYQP